MVAPLEKGEGEKTIDQLADEIADILIDYVNAKSDLKTVKGFKKPEKTKKGAVKVSGLERRNLMEIAKLKNRMAALENRMEKFIKSFKLSSIEAGRLVSEKAEEARDENEQILFDLQGQIEDLRDAMVKLSNAVKKLSGK